MIVHHSTPIGELVIGTRHGKLVLCDFAMRRGDVERSMLLTAPSEEMTDEDLIDTVKRQLDEYFSSRRQLFDLPVEYSGTENAKMVWKALSSIPYGQTVTYSRIAQIIRNPKAVRSVASCIGRNPLAVIVPCHRVIGTDGKLHGYAGGLEAKRLLLNLEGLRSY